MNNDPVPGTGGHRPCRSQRCPCEPGAGGRGGDLRLVKVLRLGQKFREKEKWLIGHCAQKLLLSLTFFFFLYRLKIFNISIESHLSFKTEDILT